MFPVPKPDGMDSKTWRHVREALEGIASKGRYGRGCRRSNCGTACLCPPCHARVALERLREPTTNPEVREDGN